MKVALSIAGSDSGGGAGIQADLKTFEAHGVFGTTAITSITAQNTVGVRGIFDLPVEVIAAQIDAVLDDFRVAVVKIGMLSSRAIVETVADRLRRNARGVPVVLDPVLVSTSGDRLVNNEAIDAIVSELFPIARLVTPNAEEAAALTGGLVKNLDGMKRSARRLLAMGATAVLVKGGHIRPVSEDRPTHVDLLIEGASERAFETEHVATRDTHGTGCTLASAIAANLALGHSLETAVERAQKYVHVAIVNAPGLGHGHGPLRHGHVGNALPSD